MERTEIGMGTSIRPELSENNPYRIDREKFYELKHFCRQYPSWKKEYNILNAAVVQKTKDETTIHQKSCFSRKTEELAIRMAYISEKIDLIDLVIREVDELLQKWIFLAVTEGFSYEYLRTTLGMPHSKGSFYNEYRKFFWLLDSKR